MADEIEVKCAFDEMVEIDKLVPNPRNPNKHPKRQIKMLARIIRATGWRAPITVSRRSGFVVRGHGRLEAARQLGCDQEPVDFQDYENEAEEYQDLIADNRIAEFAEIDEETLMEVLSEVQGIEIELTGYSQADIDKMIEQIAKDQEPDPEVEFTRELLLEHNYLVFYCENSLDWQVLVDRFDLKRVKDLIPRRGQPTGIGRVLPVTELFDRLKD